MPKTKVVNKPRLPANPSTPSIKLNELVITIIVNKVSTILAKCGIAVIPNKPCMLLICTPPNPTWKFADDDRVCDSPGLLLKIEHEEGNVVVLRVGARKTGYAVEQSVGETRGRNFALLFQKIFAA